MNQRRWTLICGVACALVAMSGQSLAAPHLAPVPLAPSQTVVAAWGHVQFYDGTYP